MPHIGVNIPLAKIDIPNTIHQEALMPYKSEAQRRFFHTDSAKKAGITESEVKEFDSASKGKRLPKVSKAAKRK